MKTSILQPDDFVVGMFVTIHNVKQKEVYNEYEQNPLQYIIQGSSPQSGRQNFFEVLKGCVIRIDAINMPFVMATIFEISSTPGVVPKSQPISLDVRELEFIKLNEEYVKVYMGNASLSSILQGRAFKDLQNIEGYETLSEALEQFAKNIEKEENKRKKDNDELS